MSSVTCQVSICSKIDNFWMFFQNEMNAGDFYNFFHCLRLAGDSTEMLELYKLPCYKEITELQIQDKNYL